MQHAKPKIEAGNRDKLDISVLTFALVNSSHQLMEGESEEQLHSVSKLRKIRNEQYGHAFKNFMTCDELVEVNDHVKGFTRLCLPDRATWCQQQIDEAMRASNQAVDLTKVKETMNQLQGLLDIKSGGSSAPAPDAPFAYPNAVHPQLSKPTQLPSAPFVQPPALPSTNNGRDATPTPPPAPPESAPPANDMELAIQVCVFIE